VRIACLLLAAGAGARLGGRKQLALTEEAHNVLSVALDGEDSQHDN